MSAYESDSMLPMFDDPPEEPPTGTGYAAFVRSLGPNPKPWLPAPPRDETTAD